MKKALIVRLLLAVIVVFLIVNVFFPFSPLSLHKVVDFTPSSYYFEYQNEIQQFKEQYSRNKNELVEDILPLYDSEWLFVEENVSFNKKQLDYLLKDLTIARNTMSEFKEKNTASPDAQTFLKIYIEDLESLEGIINEIKNSQWMTKKELKKELRNVPSYFRNSFMYFKSFCEEVFDIN